MEMISTILCYVTTAFVVVHIIFVKTLLEKLWPCYVSTILCLLTSITYFSRIDLFGVVIGLVWVLNAIFWFSNLKSRKSLIKTKEKYYTDMRIDMDTLQEDLRRSQERLMEILDEFTEERLEKKDIEPKRSIKKFKL